MNEKKKLLDCLKGCSIILFYLFIHDEQITREIIFTVKAKLDYHRVLVTKSKRVMYIFITRCIYRQ